MKNKVVKSWSYSKLNAKKANTYHVFHVVTSFQLILPPRISLALRSYECFNMDGFLHANDFINY